jgi:nucleotide-binding universal stress UspA family protein
MPLYRTIVCAIDFSEHSKKALHLAAALAARLDARVYALHVIDFLLAEAAAAAYNEEQLKADAERELRAIVADVTNAQVEVEVRVGRAEHEVLACAATAGADLIAMGTQGLGGVRKLLFGSVTEKVLRSVKVPVLAVPHREGQPLVHPGIHAIVAGLDLEDESAAVAAQAAALAAELRVPLTLVHAIPHGPLAPYAVEAYGEAVNVLRSEAERRLEELALPYVKQVAVTTEVRIGPPADQLAALASAQRNALAVIGLGGKGLFQRPGSTAYRVLTIADTPVLAVPARRATGA